MYMLQCSIAEIQDSHPAFYLQSITVTDPQAAAPTRHSKQGPEWFGTDFVSSFGKETKIMLYAALLNPLARMFGIGRQARSRGDAYIELMGMSDRQLEDIGLTRGLIETVIWQGPEAIEAVLPDGAIRRGLIDAANGNGKLKSGAA